MNRKRISKTSQTDWKRLHDLRDEEIDFSEIPKVTDEQMQRAVLRIGGKPVRGKVRVSLSLDANIIA